jgi:hypothetical protein
MATLNQVRHAMHAQPFQPFAIKLADGRTYVVKQAEPLVRRASRSRLDQLADRR